MLVDFRFDTFGEITVLGAVALTAYALAAPLPPVEGKHGIARNSANWHPTWASRI